MKKHIVIVGGGSAGWITLSYLAATTDCKLTIIHSNEVDPIGVGESTTPTIKHVAEAVGVDEKTWMKDAKATFKYGVELFDFNRIGSRWMHSFDDMIPHQAFGVPISDNGKEEYRKELTSIDYYLRYHKTNSYKFNSSHGCFQHIYEKGLSPFNKKWQPTVSRYPGYAYHINAFEFGNSLKKHTSAERYTEKVQTVVDVSYNDQGIEYLTLDNGEQVYADLFVDCTGFKKLLINKLTKWKSYTELANNSAVWGSIKGVTSYKPVTQVHAQESGWIWTIPTWGQIGSGYVYSNKFSSPERAEEVITAFWKERCLEFVPFKHIEFNAGRLEEPAIKNVVANGLAQSFIEPLQATSVMITCVTARVLSDIINRHPDEEWDQKLSQIHSTRVRQFIDHIKKFVHFHYRLSERTDTPYWKSFNNDPTAVKELSDYIDILHKMKWVNHGETSLNQFNWVSMLLGFEKQYANKLSKIDDIEMENYLHYTEMLVANYKHLTNNNLTVEEVLQHIHS